MDGQQSTNESISTMTASGQSLHFDACAMPALTPIATFQWVPNWSEPEQRAWDPKVSRSQNSIHASALERIAFGSLSLSVCYRPTVGDVRRHGTYR
jgi:hypothetical protein